MGKCGSVAVNFPAEWANVGWRWPSEVDGSHAVSFPFCRYHATSLVITLGCMVLCGEADLMKRCVVRLDYLSGLVLF